MITKNRFWYLLKKGMPILPWRLLPAPGQPRLACAEFLRPFYEARARRLGPLAWPVGLLSAAIFQLWAPFRARQSRRRHGLTPDFAAAALRAARRHFVDPEEFAIHHRADEAFLRTHVRRFEEGAINRVFNARHWRSGCELHDKLAFAALCARHGLPHPETRARCVAGRIEALSLPPSGKVFVKPSTGMSGYGCAVVDLSQARTREEAGAILLEAAGARPDWIAQDLLLNHPDIADFSLNALSTMRVITLMDEAGRPEIVATTIKIATRPEAVTDNGAQGGIFLGVDPETGEIGLGAKLLGGRIHESQPGNGVRTKGRKVPFVAESRALAVEAHRLMFPGYAYIGWDIAVTPEGPVMIEGNAKPSMTVAQRSFFRNMPPERFAALLAHHMSAAGEERPPRHAAAGRPEIA